MPRKARRIICDPASSPHDFTVNRHLHLRSGDTKAELDKIFAPPCELW